MARQTPRFLYSNPQNSKSKGPFIIHTIEPRLIAKIVYGCKEDPIAFRVLDNIDGCDPEHLQAVLKHANEWLIAQLKIKSIDLDLNELDF